MIELVNLLSKAVSEEMLLQQLSESIDAYVADSNETNRKILTNLLAVVGYKFMTDPEEDNVKKFHEMVEKKNKA
jgi:hypothetical protein